MIMMKSVSCKAVVKIREGEEFAAVSQEPEDGMREERNFLLEWSLA